jgi:hypothetical protein
LDSSIKCVAEARLFEDSEVSKDVPQNNENDDGAETASAQPLGSISGSYATQ